MVVGSYCCHRLSCFFINNQGTMNKEEKIKEICQDSIGKLGVALSEAIANAISEGYKLGWEECAKQLGVKL